MKIDEMVKEWFNYSKNDLVSAKHLFYNLHPKQIEIACYLSQQCAEKALKGYLILKDIDPIKTHNLVELCNLCMEYDESFSQIFDSCSSLNPYGARVRYPNELAVDDTIAKMAIEKAEVIYVFCFGKIQVNDSDKQPEENNEKCTGSNGQ